MKFYEDDKRDRPVDLSFEEIGQDWCRSNYRNTDLYPWPFDRRFRTFLVDELRVSWDERDFKALAAFVEKYVPPSNFDIWSALLALHEKLGFWWERELGQLPIGDRANLTASQAGTALLALDKMADMIKGATVPTKE